MNGNDIVRHAHFGPYVTALELAEALPGGPCGKPGCDCESPSSKFQVFTDWPGHNPARSAYRTWDEAVASAKEMAR